MIDPVHKIIFIHPEKSGGTSIERVFDAEIVRDRTKAPKDRAFVYWPEQVASAKNIANKYPAEWKTYKKIGIVRNPADRFLSRHRYFLKANKALTEVGQGKIDEHGVWQRLLLASIKHKSPGSFSFRSQQLAKLGDIRQYDYILRCESLQEDWRKVRKMFSLNDLPVEIPHANKSGERVNLMNYIPSPAMKAKLALLLQLDLKKFGYKIGKVSESDMDEMKQLHPSHSEFLQEVYSTG